MAQAHMTCLLAIREGVDELRTYRTRPSTASSTSSHPLCAAQPTRRPSNPENPPSHRISSGDISSCSEVVKTSLSASLGGGSGKKDIPTVIGPSCWSFINETCQYTSEWSRVNQICENKVRKYLTSDDEMMMKRIMKRNSTNNIGERTGQGYMNGWE